MSVIVLFSLTALAHALGATDQTRRQPVDDSDHSNASNPRVFPRVNPTPVVDPLVLAANSSESVTPSSHNQLTTAVVIVVLASVALCTLVAV
ncbi:hypothetical protein OG21DRAFT_1511757 [Imleria badia]|nr:hypothetical protein OG21DRAFT_1511757 [Imleria badia]